MIKLLPSLHSRRGIQLGREIHRVVLDLVPRGSLWGTPEPTTKLENCSEFPLMTEAALRADTVRLKSWLNLLDKQTAHQPAGSAVGRPFVLPVEVDPDFEAHAAGTFTPPPPPILLGLLQVHC